MAPEYYLDIGELDQLNLVRFIVSLGHLTGSNIPHDVMSGVFIQNNADEQAKAKCYDSEVNSRVVAINHFNSVSLTLLF